MSTSSLQARRVMFPAKQQVELEPFDPGQPKAGEVLVKIHLSLMSTGTENIVFNRLFEPGTHWDNWIKYPFYPGYTSVGKVEAVGEGVTTPKVGDRVALRVKHRSHAVIDAADVYPIPDNLAFEQAIWFALAKIAFQGARGAEYFLADSVLIIGAGPIGQMSIRWARAAGVTSIIVADPTTPQRLALAKAGGADEAFAKPVDQAHDEIIAANGGVLPRVVIDTTGHAAVFGKALPLVADGGRIVILGDTGAPGQQTLTSDVIRRGLTIIGTHDAHNNAQYNNRTVTKAFFALASTGRFSLEGLTSHVFDPENCAEAYATANRERANTMGIIFDWTNELKKR